MSNPYIQTTADEEKQLLQRVGASSIDEIFNDQVPADYEYDGTFDLPPALSEFDLQREMAGLSAANRGADMPSFMGAGVYEHFIPSAVSHLAGRSEFVTAYTPYQPEASQGTLQAFFEYQSLVARLFDMEVSNASLYDGASALGEALFLALAAKPDRKRIILPATLHPDYRAVVETYLAHGGVEIDIAPSKEGVTCLHTLESMASPAVAAIVVQQPNHLGCLEEVREFRDVAKQSGALLIAVCDPISLGLLEPPGAYDADIAVGEGQPLGLRRYLGGESLGLFTCRNEFIRKAPGRLVGIARDKLNRRGFVLTLQAREQHIRREKATSNICTNNAHNALRAAIYLSLMGPEGIRRVARMCARNTQRLRRAIMARKPAAIAFPHPCFKEFAVRLRVPARQACSEMLEPRNGHGPFMAGVPLDTMGPGYENVLLVCVTECRTDAEIDDFAAALGEYL